MQDSKLVAAEALDGKDVDIRAARELVERILHSRTLERSPQLRSLFVTERALEAGEAPSEYEVGSQALQRPVDYSPNDDNIVRVQARLLRLKLQTYFETEAPGEPLRVTIPKGSYLPRFELNAVAETPIPEPPPTPAPSVEAPRRRYLLAALGATILLVAGGLWSRSATTGPPERFWRQIFPPAEHVLVIPTDASLVVLQDIAERRIPLGAYVGRDYWHDLSSPSPEDNRLRRELSMRRLTSLTSTRMVMRLAQRNESRQAKLEMQYARDLKATALDQSNLILIGADHSNPWVTHFQSQSRIRLRYEPQTFVGERRTNGRQFEELFRISSTSDRVFGLISYVPNGPNGKAALLIQGTGATGTDVASDFLFDDARFGQFLASIETLGRIPYFDLLVESKNIGGSAPTGVVLRSDVLHF